MLTMLRLFAIAVRLAIVFALAVNGIGVATYAMHAQAAEPESVSASPPPCHAGAQASSTTTAADADAGSLPAPHDCCGKTCACDFVAAAALAPLPWLGLAFDTPSTRTERVTGDVLYVRIARPLRPPIA